MWHIRRFDVPVSHNKLTTIGRKDLEFPFAELMRQQQGRGDRIGRFA